MKRGAGRMLIAALHAHNYANGGMVMDQQPVQHFDRGGEVGGYKPPVAKPTSNQAAPPTTPGSRWTPTADLTPQQWKQQIDAIEATRVQPQYGGGDRGGQQVTNSGAVNEWVKNYGQYDKDISEYGYSHGYAERPHDSGFAGGLKDAFLNPAVLSAVGMFAFPGVAAAYGGGTAGIIGAGATIGGAAGYAGTGNTKGLLTGAVTGGALAGVGAALGGGAPSGGNPELEQFSRMPPSTSFGQNVSGANMSVVPSGYASGPTFMGAGNPNLEHYDPSWRAQNSSQVPGSEPGGFDSGSPMSPGPDMSYVPGGSPGGFDPGGMGGAGGGSGGAFDPFGGFSGPGGSSGMAPGFGTDASRVNPNFSGGASDTPLSIDRPAYASGNAGFNVDASYSGGDMPYGDVGDVSSGVGNEVTRNPFDTQQSPTQIQGKPSVIDRIGQGVMSKVQNLPESIGRALPGMVVGLGAAALNKSKSASNDPAVQAAQQQSETDKQRDSIALDSQKQFSDNANKYGTEDYYRQMGDMAGMQFQTGRAQQRQELARQLAAQGKDPTTTAALLRQFDNNTSTGVVGARNNSYLSARNSGLGYQAQAAGMFSGRDSAGSLSNATTGATNRNRQSTQDWTGLLNAPFTQQSQDAGGDSGRVSNSATNAAAKATSDKYGLDSSVYGRQ